MDMEEIKVLVIEDDSTYASLLVRSLELVKVPKYILQTAHSLGDGLEKYSNGDYDVVLLDLFLPDSEGVKTLRTARLQITAIPIVVLTGLQDEETAVSALRHGAQDYLIKHNVDRHLLSQAIRFAVERKKVEVFQREQLHFLQSVMDNVPCPLFIKDTDLRYGACNNAFETLLGRSKENIIGMSSLDVFDDQNAEIIRNKELELLQGSSPLVYEITMSDARSESDIAMIFHETIHHRGDGSLAGFVGVALSLPSVDVEGGKADLKGNTQVKKYKQEIKALKKERSILAEELLQKAKSRSEFENHILRLNPFIVFHLEMSDGWPVVNASKNIHNLGYDSDTMADGKFLFRDLIHEDDLEQVQNKRENSYQIGDKNVILKYRIIDKSGSVREILDYTSFLEINKKENYLICHLLDVSF